VTVKDNGEEFYRAIRATIRAREAREDDRSLRSSWDRLTEAREAREARGE
jgi:hypothetical protein